MNEEDWINSCLPAKRDKLTRALEEEILPSSEEKRVRVKLFPKREVCDGSYKPATESCVDKARIIQGYYLTVAGSVWGASYAAYQKTICQVVSQEPLKLNHAYHCRIGCGMNMTDIADWMYDALQRPGTKTFYERDGKSWDATMNEDHLNLANEAMDEMDPAFARFNRQCYNAYGKYVHGNSFVKFTSKTTRKSGHYDTSSGNSYINLLIIINALEELGGFVSADIIVMGDDMLAILHDATSDVSRLSTIEETYGITPKARVFTCVYDVTFVHGQWYPTHDDKLAFGPFISRTLVKLLWTIRPIIPKEEAAWVNTVCESFVPFFHDCPILGLFLRKQISSGSRVTNLREKVDFMRKNDHRVTQIDWDKYFMLKFGVSRLDCEPVEDMIKKVKLHEPTLIIDPLVDFMYSVENGDISDRPPVSYSYRI